MIRVYIKSLHNKGNRIYREKFGLGKFDVTMRGPPLINNIFLIVQMYGRSDIFNSRYLKRRGHDL
jgi:hypothetical protein